MLSLYYDHKEKSRIRIASHTHFKQWGGLPTLGGCLIWEFNSQSSADIIRPNQNNIHADTPSPSAEKQRRNLRATTNPKHRSKRTRSQYHKPPVRFPGRPGEGIAQPCENACCRCDSGIAVRGFADVQLRAPGWFTGK